MPARHYDPYLAQSSAEWRQRARDWSRRPAETALVFVAGLAMLAVALAMLLGQWPRIVAMLQLLRDEHGVASLLMLFLFAIGTGRNAGRRRAVERQRDWLASQPLAAPVRSAVTLRWHLRLVFPTLLVGSVLLVLANSSVLALLLFGLVLSSGYAAGLLLSRRDRLSPSKPIGRQDRARQSPFAGSGSPTISAWQWIESGGALAPARVAPLALLLLTVPSGPWTLLLVALYAMALLALGNSYLRAVAVLPLAEAWLRAQCLPSRRWLAGALPVPLVLSLALAVFAALPLLWTGHALTALLAASGVLAVALLHLAVTLAWRRQPRRIPLQAAIQWMILLLVLQVMPPVAPLCWAIQITLLARRAWS